MSLAVVLSRGLAGMHSPLVRVEVHVGGGLPGFHVVGLPDTEVREARDRVRAALATARFDFPQSRVIVSLAPADLPKESSRFDLPIALGILAATRQVPAKALLGLEFAGELALSGELRPVRGALAMTLAAHRDGRAFVLPETSAILASVTLRFASLAVVTFASAIFEVVTALPANTVAASSVTPMAAAVIAFWSVLSGERGRSAARNVATR